MDIEQLQRWENLCNVKLRGDGWRVCTYGHRDNDLKSDVLHACSMLFSATTITNMHISHDIQMFWHMQCRTVNGFRLFEEFAAYIFRIVKARISNNVRTPNIACCVLFELTCPGQLCRNQSKSEQRSGNLRYQQLQNYKIMHFASALRVTVSIKNYFP